MCVCVYCVCVCGEGGGDPVPYIYTLMHPIPQCVYLISCMTIVPAAMELAQVKIKITFGLDKS